MLLWLVIKQLLVREGWWSTRLAEMMLRIIFILIFSDQAHANKESPIGRGTSLVSQTASLKILPSMDWCPIFLYKIPIWVDTLHIMITKIWFGNLIQILIWLCSAGTQTCKECSTLHRKSQNCVKAAITFVSNNCKWRILDWLFQLSSFVYTFVCINRVVQNLVFA